MASALFWPAIFQGRCLVPGDILFGNFPWKAVYGNSVIHNPLLSDAVDAYHPWMVALKQAYGHGAWPLWNFNAYAGSPLAANLASAPFHPFNLCFLFMDVPEAATFFPFIRLILASFGLFILLRSWKVSLSAAFLGGLLYGFCGVHIVWLSNYPNTNITALAPWIFWLSDGVIRRGGYSWVLGFSALSAVQFLGGHPETSFHLYAALFFFVFFRLIQQRQNGAQWRSLFPRVLALAFAGGFALAMCAIQLLPFLEYLPQTTRYLEIAQRGENLHFSLSFKDVARLLGGTLFSPDFFGNPIHNNYWEFANYNEQNAHFTVTGLFFSVLGLTMLGKGKDPSQKALNLFFCCLGLAAFLIAARTPFVFDLVVQLPGFKLAANHRLIFVFVFAFSITAALCISALCKGDHLISPWRFVGASVLLAMVLISLFWLDHGHLNASQISYRLEHLFICMVMIICLAVLPFGLNRFGPKIFSPGRAAVFMAVCEIWIWASDYNTFLPPDQIFPQTPMIRFLTSRPGLFRCSGLNGTFRLGAEAVYGLEGLVGMDPMKTVRYERILARINGEYHSVMTPPLSGTDSPWLDFLNLKYLATSPRTFLDPDRWKLLHKGTDGNVFENRFVLPRYFWAKEVIQGANEQNAFNLADRHVSELGEKVVLEALDQDLPKPGNGWKNPIPKAVFREANRFELDLETIEPGLLVTSEIWYPGWRVQIDGKPGQILKANSAFMAVPVPENARHLIFSFDPGTFKTGLIISTAAWALWAAAVFFIGARRKTRGNGFGYPPQFDG